MENIPDKIRLLFEKGISASKKRNWDYAITLFTAVLDTAPDHTPVRKQLRIAEIQKFDSYKFPLWHKITAIPFNLIPYLQSLYYHYRKNWISALQQLEKVLRHNPKNIFLLRQLAKSAEAAGFTETVCSIYETMYLLRPNDLKTLKKLADCYTLLDQPKKARTFYQHVLAISPMDFDARRGLQNIAAEKTIDKGWEETGSYRDKIRDETQANLFEKEARLVRSQEDLKALIRDAEHRLTQQPDSLPLLRKLAELHLAAEQHSNAIKYYEQAALLDPADASIKKDITYTKISQFNKKIKDNPKQVEKLTEQKQQFILADTQKRVQEYPTHLPLRYEMGCIYLDRGLYDKAIAEFQISVKDPKYRILSLNKLGSAFYQKKMYDLAANQFQKAIQDLHDWDETKKEIIYNLGMVYEAMGQKEKAIAEYKKIYEQDINYRDIAKKISQSY